MVVKFSISLDSDILADIDLWCAANGNLKRSQAISFMTTRYIQSCNEKIFRDSLKKNCKNIDGVERDWEK